MSKVFKTQSGAVLALRPITADLCQKCVKVDRDTQGKTPEETAPEFLAMAAELFESGITHFKLTQEQAAMVVLVRAELIKKMPTLKRNISEWAYFVIYSCGGEYPEMTRLALAILEVTQNDRPGKEKAKTGFLPFGRFAPGRKQAG